MHVLKHEPLEGSGGMPLPENFNPQTHNVNNEKAKMLLGYTICIILCVGAQLVASHPGLPLQLLFHGCEKICEGRPGYEATQLIASQMLLLTELLEGIKRILFRHVICNM